jgi:hypothetical protein
MLCTLNFTGHIRRIVGPVYPMPDEPGHDCMHLGDVLSEISTVRPFVTARLDEASAGHDSLVHPGDVTNEVSVSRILLSAHHQGGPENCDQQMVYPVVRHGPSTVRHSEPIDEVHAFVPIVRAVERELGVHWTARIHCNNTDAVAAAKSSALNIYAII